MSNINAREIIFKCEKIHTNTYRAVLSVVYFLKSNI